MAQYVVGLDSSLKRMFVWKTTGDPTTLTTWAAQDTGLTFGAEVMSIWAVLDGTDIHVATCSGRTGSPDASSTNAFFWGGMVQYHVFDTTTDTWSTKREWVFDGVSVVSVQKLDSFNAVSIGVRSDGDVIVLHVTDGVADLRPRYSVKEAGTWTRDVQIDASDQYSTGVLVMGASDRAHFFYYNDTLNAVKHRSLSSGNVLDTAATIDTSIGLLHGVAARGISYADNGNTVVKASYVESDDTLTGIRIDVSGANPTIATDTFAADNDVEDINLSVVACYAVDGTDTWLLYSGGGASGVDQDIYSDKQADGGSWGTDTEEQDAVTGNRISAGVYDRSGTKLGYVWLDGTTTSFDEKDISATAVPVFMHDYRMRRENY